MEMIIREINTNSKFATVTFDYDELRCLCNSLYEVSRFDGVEMDKDFNNVYAKIIELFSLVKHCNIPEFELKLMYKLLFDKTHTTEKGDKRCCENCGYYNEDRDNQPCNTCAGFSNWEADAERQE